MNYSADIIAKCLKLLGAYRAGNLGYMKMPEDENPGLDKMDEETRLVYFTLPMALNYQRNSYTLWESVLKTYQDDTTKDIFSIKNSAEISEDNLRKKLLQYKIALQPNKHIQTWMKIAQTILTNRGTVKGLFEACSYDFLELKKLIQVTHKSGFPYLSGPKIFNYWSWIIQVYGGVKLNQSDYIDIAPDTHITQCSVKLGVISSAEALSLNKDAISLRWREALDNSGITPIQMHAPLWFWSRNNFQFIL